MCTKKIKEVNSNLIHVGNKSYRMNTVTTRMSDVELAALEEVLTDSYIVLELDFSHLDMVTTANDHHIIISSDVKTNNIGAKVYNIGIPEFFLDSDDVNYTTVLCKDYMEQVIGETLNIVDCISVNINIFTGDIYDHSMEIENTFVISCNTSSISDYVAFVDNYDYENTLTIYRNHVTFYNNDSPDLMHVLTYVHSTDINTVKKLVSEIKNNVNIEHMKKIIKLS